VRPSRYLQMSLEITEKSQWFPRVSQLKHGFKSNISNFQIFLARMPGTFLFLRFKGAFYCYTPLTVAQFASWNIRSLISTWNTSVKIEREILRETDLWIPGFSSERYCFDLYLCHSPRAVCRITAWDLRSHEQTNWMRYMDFFLTFSEFSGTLCSIGCRQIPAVL
jgi:hypothetical protein